MKGFFKVKNGVFLFGISFFVVEIFTFLYYANEESDDVIGGNPAKKVQHSHSRIFQEILKQCSLIAPQKSIPKETE